jgi:regulatory protein
MTTPGRRSASSSRRGRSADTPDPDDAQAPDPYILALRWLGRRELTERQIRQRLARLGVLPDAIDAAVERLRAVRAIDDVRVAAAYARTASQVKGRGRSRIARELSAMGLGEAIVKDAVDAAASPDEERARLERALARKARGLDLDEVAHRRKIIASLMRQGFAFEGIRAALKARGRDADADD